MIDEAATISQTAKVIADATANIALAFGLLKKKAAGRPDAEAFFHRAEHIFQECSRTARELLASSPASVLAAADALAAHPADQPS